MPSIDLDWNLLLAALATAATLVSVGWGIFNSLGPRLKLTLRLGEDRTRFGVGEHAPWCYFYHLRVENRGRRIARGVCVKVTHINEARPDGSYSHDELGAHLRLAWAHARENPCHRDIAPRDTETCNLGYLKHHERFVLDLCTPWPPTFSGIVHAGQRMLVEVVAVAEGAKSRPLRIEVAWDGGWSDDPAQMRRHLVIGTP